MKRIISILICIISCFMLLATSGFSFAFAVSSIDISYTVENGEATVTGYTGNPITLTIPDTLGQYPVTAIGDDAFYQCTSLTELHIGQNVRTIGANAFYLCTSLREVILPNSVMSISNHAFRNCSTLERVCFGDKLVRIGEWAFYGTALRNVIIPDSVTDLSSTAFYKCFQLKSASIGNGVRTLHADTFNECGLTQVVLPQSLTVIEANAFSSCDALSTVYYQGSNTDWQNVQIAAEGNTTLDYAVFHYNVCTDKDWLYILGESNATVVGNINLSSTLDIPSTLADQPVTSIGISAFAYRDSLVTVSIPDSVTRIGSRAFYQCEALTQIHGCRNVNAIGNMAFVLCSSLSRFAIPAQTTMLGHGAFASCTSLTQLIIPQGMQSIGAEAFYNCSSLSQVFYSGAEADWSNISIETRNTRLTSSYIHYKYTATDFGDITDDGYVNMRDALKLYRYVNGQEAFTARQVAIADQDGNNFVNMRDALMMYQQVAAI